MVDVESFSSSRLSTVGFFFFADYPSNSVVDATNPRFDDFASGELRKIAVTQAAFPIPGREIVNKKKDESCDLSSLVGHRIEISNPFLKDLEVVILFVKWIDEKVPNYR